MWEWVFASIDILLIIWLFAINMLFFYAEKTRKVLLIAYIPSIILGLCYYQRTESLQGLIQISLLIPGIVACLDYYFGYKDQLAIKKKNPL